MWGKERKLDPDEKPLAVQLRWTSDNREGRFVLKADKDGLEVKKNLRQHRPSTRLICELTARLRLSCAC